MGPEPFGGTDAEEDIGGKETAEEHHFRGEKEPDAEPVSYTHLHDAGEHTDDAQQGMTVVKGPRGATERQRGQERHEYEMKAFE